MELMRGEVHSYNDMFAFRMLHRVMLAHLHTYIASQPLVYLHPADAVWPMSLGTSLVTAKSIILFAGIPTL